MNESKMKPIAMRCNKAQFNDIKSILIDNLLTVSSISPFDGDCVLVNNRFGTLGMVTNYASGPINNDHNREYFDEWDKDTFLKYCGIEVKTKTENKMKTVITAQELLEIHKIACIKWKAIIRNDYLSRINLDQTVHFSQEEINEMFNAATPEQKPVLEKIFGKQVKPIEWDRIKTGSQVMIESTGEHCCGTHNMDLTKPVDVVFYKTPHCINDVNKFSTKGVCAYYCTFHQNGKYALFAAHKNTDYITEVVQY
jgi:hypothetical protein